MIYPADCMIMMSQARHSSAFLLVLVNPFSPRGTLYSSQINTIKMTYNPDHHDRILHVDDVKLDVSVHGHDHDHSDSSESAQHSGSTKINDSIDMETETDLPSDFGDAETMMLSAVSDRLPTDFTTPSDNGWEATTTLDSGPRLLNNAAVLAAHPSSKPNPLVYLDISVGQTYTGRLVVELFANVVPRTAHNFLRLCRSSPEALSYKGSAFHRIVPRFLLQGGDILGGGDSHRQCFPDENFLLKERSHEISFLEQQ